MTILDSGFMMDDGAISLPLTPEEEKRIVDELTIKSENNLKDGNLYYVISNRWFTEWQKYTGQWGEYPVDEQQNYPRDVVHSITPCRPGSIDNSDIISNGNGFEGGDYELYRTLSEEHDYVLVPEEVWEKLFEWYKGGPPLPRKLISQGVHAKKFSVEVYPLCLNLIDSRDNKQSIIRLSKKASISELYEKVCMLTGIEQEKVCIWDYFNKQKQSRLDNLNKTVEDCSLQMDQDILVEVHVDGFVPSGSGMDSTGNELALVLSEPPRSSVSIAGGPSLSNGYPTNFTFNFYQGSSARSPSRDIEDGSDMSSTVLKRERGGLSGLQNMGNTCFMNSAIQCLVHTPPLVEYFLQDYSEDINRENPLGMNGELALAFGKLLRELWCSGQRAVAPRSFKSTLSRFAPQFSGYNQHDSQELLAFLLDGLHEDLNRVKQKPYIETKDSDDRPDEEVAEECWRNHKARNDSLIVDVSQGQYKSTLVCPTCGKISITFDPFMYLSLPLPSTNNRSMTVTVFYGDGRALPLPYTVTVSKLGLLKDLIQALGTACCLESDEFLMIAEVYNHKLYKYFINPLDPLSLIKAEDYIVAYRLPKEMEGSTILEINHRCQAKTCAVHKQNYSEMMLVGTPLVTYLGKKPPTGANIDPAVDRVLSSLTNANSSLTKTNNNCKENGCVSEAIEPAMDNMEVEEETLSFQLYEFNENSRGKQKRVDRDSLLQTAPCDRLIATSSPCVKVLLDWTRKEHELYDAQYLNDLPQVFKAGAKKTRQESVSLFSCLEAFLKEEPLGPDDMWYCPSCKEHRQATKKLDLWRLPEILVFHLKRFSYSRWYKNKLDTFVNFPIHNLDLSKYVKSKGGAPQSCLYELYAISNHYGGLGGGHYSAYAKLIDQNNWYHFDDCHVSQVGESEIKTSAAYVLFYQRVKTDETSIKEGEASRDDMMT